MGKGVASMKQLNRNLLIATLVIGLNFALLLIPPIIEGVNLLTQ
jgi:hypothetical protein